MSWFMGDDKFHSLSSFNNLIDFPKAPYCAVRRTNIKNVTNNEGELFNIRNVSF